RELASKGLVIPAASDEDRETVVKFADEKKYAFPIALDPGRKTHDAFDIVGIPNTYLFDRAGRLDDDAGIRSGNRRVAESHVESRRQTLASRSRFPSATL